MIDRKLIAVLAPPLAVFKYGCASCTGAPIAVFWLAGLASIGYGLMGGVLGLPSRSWVEILLGIVLWGIAAAWTWLVLGGVSEDLQQGQNSPLQRRVVPHTEESDPFKEVHNVH